MNLFDTVFKTISAPFSAFFPKKYPYVENGVRYVAPAPITTHPQVYNQSNQVIRSQPPQTLSPSQELRQIETEMGIPLTNFNDAEALLYLPKSRQYLREFREKKAQDVQGYQKLNAGIAEQNQKLIQKEQSAWNSYDAEQNRREANSRMVRQTHDNAEKPYLDYLNHIQDIQNKMHVPFPPIKFG